MAFALLEEQQMLHDSVERFMRTEYGFEKRRSILAGSAGWSQHTWEALAGLGLLGLPFAEEDGGLGQGMLETTIAMRAFGGGLLVEPYLPTVVLAGGVLRHVATPEQRQRFVPTIASGELVLGFAFAEPESRFNLADVSVSAVRRDGGYSISGRKSVVLAAPLANALLVTARTGGSRRDATGISVFHVPTNARGVTLHSYVTVDGVRAADVDFADVFVPDEDVLGERDGALPGVERAADEAIVAICADMAGSMWALNERTLDYVRTRVAFGKALSEFQVLQHRLVDMRVACEYADAMVQMAAGAERDRLAQAASAAKVQVGRDSRFVAQAALHLHGAAGMTDEIDISHYFRRITVLDTMLGTPDYHQRRYGRLLRQSGPALEFAA